MCEKMKTNYTTLLGQFKIQ